MSGRLPGQHPLQELPKKQRGHLQWGRAILSTFRRLSGTDGVPGVADG
jgi:hypothetical protein